MTDRGDSWLRLADDASVVLLPLRAFLGFTFSFAGLQKLADPNFFRSSSRTSIQSQLRATAHTSPLHGFLHGLVHLATPLGLLIAFGELAVGLGVIFGVYTRLAAAGGMVIAFSLFLTVSFHSKPYYTGADIGYFFAFMPLLVAGAGRFRLSALMERLAASGSLGSLGPAFGGPAPTHRVSYSSHGGHGGRAATGYGRQGAVRHAPVRRAPVRRARPPIDPSRREIILAGALGAAGFVFAGLVAGIGRLAGGTKAPRAGTSLGSRGHSASSTTVDSTTTVASSVPSGTKLGAASVVPVGGSATFQDPSTGDPGVVIQPKAGQFLAFDTICPHAGCTVGYSSSQNLLVCPCHGSTFNATTGEVLNGPAASNLRMIKITEGSDGQLYVD